VARRGEERAREGWVRWRNGGKLGGWRGERGRRGGVAVKGKRDKDAGAGRRRYKGVWRREKGEAV